MYLFKKRKSNSLLTALSLALVLGATSTLSYADTAAEIRAAQATQVSLKQAINYANKQGAGELIGVEFDDDRDGGSYEVKYSNGTTVFEVTINAMSGDITKRESERLEREEVMTYNQQQQAKVSLLSVIDAVEKQARARVLAIEFEYDANDNQHPSYYEVTILKDSQIIELKIDADTGREFAREVEG